MASGVCLLCLANAEVRRCTFLLHFPSTPLNGPTVHLLSRPAAPLWPFSPSDLASHYQLRQINDFIQKEPAVPLGGELTLPWELRHIILNDLAFLRHSVPLPLPLKCLPRPHPPLPSSPHCSLVFHAAENRALFLGPDSCGRHIWRQRPRCAHPCP